MLFSSLFSTNNSPAGEDQRALQRATELGRRGIERARPLAEKAGKGIWSGLKKAGISIAAAGKSLAEMTKSAVEQRRANRKSGAKTVAGDAPEDAVAEPAADQPKSSE